MSRRECRGTRLYVGGKFEANGGFFNEIGHALDSMAVGMGNFQTYLSSNYFRGLGDILSPLAYLSTFVEIHLPRGEVTDTHRYGTIQLLMWVLGI